MLTDPQWRQLGATLAPFLALVMLAGFAFLLARGQTFLLAYDRASIGIPAIMLLVFAALPQTPYYALPILTHAAVASQAKGLM